MSAPSLAWLQLALEEQEALDVKTQVNVAARRVDVLVGEGLRAAVQPDEDAGAVVFHGALAFHQVATEEQKEALVERLGEDDLDVDFAVVASDWLAFRRIRSAGEIDSPASLGETFHSFLAQSLDALKAADTEGIL
ncbi:MAG: hypothetical protein KY397_03630 [Gemmatimonadetes bacterium]|nr:hypothetical protein [Gemmatimonadota bacterium]